MGRKAVGYVEVHGENLRVVFNYQGQRCREVMRGMPPTAKNIKAAELLLAEINEKIRHGTFNYVEYFPESKKAAKLAEEAGVYTTIGQYLDAFMRIKSTTLADATKSQYQNDVIRWKEWFGEDTPVAKLTVTKVEEVVNAYPWPSNRRFNNAMSPLRGALARARRDHPRLPDWLENIEFRPPEEANPDPVTAEEMMRILEWLRDSRDERIWAYFAFAFATGLRPEEIVALCWSDVDTTHNRVHVNKAKSYRGRIGPTKTKGKRFVDLGPVALKALETMEPWTRKARKEIFQNPWTDRAWHDGRSPRENAWIPALKALNIEPRRAYCTRHTFATLLLQTGARVAYVSAQMGHTTPSQVEKTYAKWLPDADGGWARARLAEAFGAAMSSAPARLKLAAG